MQRSHFGTVWSHLVLFNRQGSHDAGLPLRLLEFLDRDCVLAIGPEKVFAGCHTSNAVDYVRSTADEIIKTRYSRIWYQTISVNDAKTDGATPRLERKLR